MDSSRPAARRGRKPEVRREDILEAALDVFGEKGFAAARLDDIAARAHVAKGTLYLYFPSKEEMFKAMVRHAVVPNVGQLQAWISAHPGPAPVILRELLPRFAVLFGTSKVGRIPKLILTESTTFPDLARFWVEEVVGPGLSAIRAILKRGVDEGSFAPVQAETPLLMMAPLLLLAMWNNGIGPAIGRPLDPAGVAAEASRLLIEGLGFREARP